MNPDDSKLRDSLNLCTYPIIIVYDIRSRHSKTSAPSQSLQDEGGTFSGGQVQEPADILPGARSHPHRANRRPGLC